MQEQLMVATNAATPNIAQQRFARSQKWQFKYDDRFFLNFGSERVTKRVALLKLDQKQFSRRSLT